MSGERLTDPERELLRELRDAGELAPVIGYRHQVRTKWTLCLPCAIALDVPGDPHWEHLTAPAPGEIEAQCVVCLAYEGDWPQECGTMPQGDPQI